MRESNIEKTTFRKRYGQFKYLSTPFGLNGAPNMFRLYIEEFILVYLDDILIYSRSKEEHKDTSILL